MDPRSKIQDLRITRTSLAILLVAGSISLLRADEPTSSPPSLVRLNLLAAVDKPVAGLEIAELIYDTSLPMEGLLGTVLVCPGQNGDGAHLLLDQVWLDWAKREQLALVATRFVSPDYLLLQGQGYFAPSPDLNRLLLHGLRSLGYPDTSLYLHGFSGGARFISAFLESDPERVAAFSVLGAREWPNLPELATASFPPGVIACGELDGNRLAPTLAFFQQGRRAGLPWIWVMLPDHPHRSSAPLDEFVRATFSCISRQSGTALPVDHTRYEPVSDFSDVSPLLTSILPCSELLPSWLALQQR